MALLSPSCLLVVVVVVVQVLLEPAALATCTTGHCVAQQPSCSGCAANDMVPDLDNCHSFYLCTGGGGYLTPSVDCDDGMVFDPINLQCVAGTDCIRCPVLCQYDCTTAITNGNPYLSSQTDCSEVYECSGTTVVGSWFCPSSTPFFDGQICQTEETRCCRCQPSCENSPLSAIDPLDCRRFWNCPNTDPPEHDGWCDDGLFFDSGLGTCTDEATCVTTCPNVVNTDGCIDPFICFVEDSFAAKCPNQCVQEYYHCTEVTYPYYQDQVLCPTGTVFHPDDHICVNPDDCPY